MAFDLSAIQRTKHATPPRILIHGDSGAGKNTFLSECPDSVFIQTEDGMNGIDAMAFPLATQLNQVYDQIDALISQDHSYKAVWIDSADWLERLIHEDVCKRENVTTIEKAAGGYGKGYLEAINAWRNILSGLDVLNKQKGMFVGFTCHSRLVHIEDPENEHGYDCFKMKLHSPKSGNGSLELLTEWADVIGFIKIRYVVGKSEVAKADVKKMKSAKQERILCLEPTAAYLAKNRYSLAPSLPFIKGEGWQSFIQSLTENQS